VAYEEAGKTIQYLGHGTYDDLVTAVAIAPHLPVAQQEAVCRELRTRLQIPSAASLVFKTQADKQHNRRATPSGLRDMAKARISPLKLLDGTRYQEFVFVSRHDARIVLDERRELTKQGSGRLLRAYLVMVSESSGAIQRGRPSPSLQAWLSGSEMMLGPSPESPAAAPYRPYTDADAHAAFNALFRPKDESPLNMYPPLPESGINSGESVKPSDPPERPISGAFPAPPPEGKSVTRPLQPRPKPSSDT
jgi:hypothetical protein